MCKATTVPTTPLCYLKQTPFSFIHAFEREMSGHITYAQQSPSRELFSATQFAKQLASWWISNGVFEINKACDNPTKVANRNACTLSTQGQTVNCSDRLWQVFWDHSFMLVKCALTGTKNTSHNLIMILLWAEYLRGKLGEKKKVIEMHDQRLWGFRKLHYSKL